MWELESQSQNTYQLQAGQPGVQILAQLRFLSHVQNIHTNSGAYQTSLFNGYRGSFSGLSS
jgi:hypothetical protein